MSWWKRKKRPVERPVRKLEEIKCSHGQHHDWGRWSKPYEIERPQCSEWMFAAPPSILKLQQRTCKRCQLVSEITIHTRKPGTKEKPARDE